MTVRRVSRDYDISPSLAPPSVLFQRVGTIPEDASYLHARLFIFPFRSCVDNTHAARVCRASEPAIPPSFLSSRARLADSRRTACLISRAPPQRTSVTSVAGVEIWVTFRTIIRIPIGRIPIPMRSRFNPEESNFERRPAMVGIEGPREQICFRSKN
jgi:hypothetical protein